MENNSKNLIAAAYLSGVGEAFKKSKTLPQDELEKYIEDAKLLRREFIKRSRDDGYENPIEIIENAKKNAMNTPPRQNIRPSVTIPNSRNVNMISQPSNVSIIEPVTPLRTSLTNISTVSPYTNVSAVSPVSPISNISAISPVSNVSPITPISNISAISPITPITPISNISAISPVSNSPTLTPLKNVSALSPITPLSISTVETPKVNNAIASMILAPAPAPAPAAPSFLNAFKFGGSKRRNKTKKSNKRRNKKHTRR